jgi:hypothetical protein
MLHSFGEHESNANNKEPVNKEYSDSELFQALKSKFMLTEHFKERD